MASRFLQDRLIDLKHSVESANKAVQEFKIANNLASKGSGLLPTEQISVLTDRLTNTKMLLAEAKARLGHVQDQTSAEESLNTIFPDNQIIQGLHSKYLDLSTRAAELASSVGPDHLSVLKLRKEMDEVLASIRDVAKRLAGSSYLTAKTQSNELSTLVAQLSEEAKRESQAQLKLRELEGTADSLRDLYGNVQEQFNKLNIQPLNPIQDARIITRAAPELHKNSIKALAVFGGGALYSVSSLEPEALSRRNSLLGCFGRLNKSTGHRIYCVGVPTVEASGKEMDSSSSQASTDPMRLEELVLDAPHSRFTELFEISNPSWTLRGAHMATRSSVSCLQSQKTASRQLRLTWRP